MNYVSYSRQSTLLTIIIIISDMVHSTCLVNVSLNLQKDPLHVRHKLVSYILLAKVKRDAMFSQCRLSLVVLRKNDNDVREKRV